MTFTRKRTGRPPPPKESFCPPPLVSPVSVSRQVAQKLQIFSETRQPDIKTMTQSKKPTTASTEPAKPLPRIVNSMKQAEALTGIPKRMIRLAKSQGSDAFTPGSRINLDALRAYIGTSDFTEVWEESQKDAPGDEWTKRLKRANALRAEHQLKLLRSGSWDAEQAKLLFKVGDAAMSEVLREWLEVKHPALVADRSAPEILKINRDFLDDLLAEMTRARVAAVEKVAATLPDDDEDD